MVSPAASDAELTAAAGYAPGPGKAVSAEDELELAARLVDAMQRQLLRVRRGLRISIGLGIIALAVVALGYVVEKA